MFIHNIIWWRHCQWRHNVYTNNIVWWCHCQWRHNVYTNNIVWWRHCQWRHNVYIDNIVLWRHPSVTSQCLHIQYITVIGDVTLCLSSAESWREIWHTTSVMDTLTRNRTRTTLPLSSTPPQTLLPSNSRGSPRSPAAITAQTSRTPSAASTGSPPTGILERHSVIV